MTTAKPIQRSDGNHRTGNGTNHDSDRGGPGTGQRTRTKRFDLSSRDHKKQHSLPSNEKPPQDETQPTTKERVGKMCRVRPLVPVGSTPHRASTSGLSNTCSACGLQAPKVPRNPNLGAGFPLRCFQRLSLPNVANRPCRWRDNRHTRGPSTQVLSYYGQASSGFQRAQRIETKLSHDVLNPARVPL